MSDDGIIAKVVLLGDSGVGKTSILNRYIQNSYAENQQQTVGANFQQKVEEYQGTKITLSIWDTAGQEVYRSLTPIYYKDAQMALIVFSVAEKTSFEGVKQWVDQVKSSSTDVLLLICGNKDDIEEREVSFDDGLKLAEELGISYVETSAKSGHGVEFAFQSLVELYLSNTSSHNKEQLKRSSTVIIDDHNPAQENEKKKKCC